MTLTPLAAFAGRLAGPTNPELLQRTGLAQGVQWAKLKGGLFPLVPIPSLRYFAEIAELHDGRPEDRLWPRMPRLW